MKEGEDARLKNSSWSMREQDRGTRNEWYKNGVYT